MSLEIGLIILYIKNDMLEIILIILLLLLLMILLLNIFLKK